MQVVSRGTGRKDYSENVEFATVPTIRSHQERRVSTIELPDVVTGTELYSYDWPNFSAVALWWPEVDPLKIVAQRMVARTEAKNLVIIGLVAYASYDEYVGGVAAPTDYYGMASGYGLAELVWSKGLVYDATKCFVIYLNVICDNPYPSLKRGNYIEAINFYLSLHSIKENVIYGD